MCLFGISFLSNQKHLLADVSEAFLNAQRSNQEKWTIDSETLGRFWLLELLQQKESKIFN